MEKEQVFFSSLKEDLQLNDEKIKLLDLKGHTIVFIIDMINGFCKEGNLYSDKIKQIVPNVAKFAKKVIKNNIKIIAFNDNHNEHSPEFLNFPEHCLEDTFEAQLVSELNFPEIKVIKKNSTNGFFAFDFKANLQWDNIIIIGCCTDICVSQFALSCKTWFNQHNKMVNVIVPKMMTSTFEGENHPYETFNEISWYLMLKNGIKIVNDIE